MVAWSSVRTPFRERCAAQSLARLTGGQGSGGAGMLGALFDDGATPRRIAAHLHHWEGTDDLASAEAHVRPQQRNAWHLASMMRPQ